MVSLLVIGWGAAAETVPTLSNKIARTDWGAIRGVNFVPSYAANTYDIWHDYNHALFDRGLGLAEAVGYNSVRLWLNYAAFADSGAAMVDHVEDAVRLCQKHRLKAVINLFDSCGIRPRPGAHRMTAPDAYELFQSSARFTPAQKALMKQLFEHYVHGPGKYTTVAVGEDTPMMVLLFQDWQPTPGNDRLTANYYPELEKYANAIMDRLKDNPAVLLWDLMNEPEFASEGPIGPNVMNTPQMVTLRDAFLTHFHDFVKRRFPNEVVSIGWASLEEAAHHANLADVLTFHVYAEGDSLEATIARAVDLGRRTHKPIFITETLANFDFGKPDFGSLASDEAQLAHYQKVLPILLRSPVGWMAWGLVISRDFDPSTDIFYPNGEPRPAALYLERELKPKVPITEQRP